MTATTATRPRRAPLARTRADAGRFYAFGLQYDKMHRIGLPHSPGSIVLTGTVYDGDGAPIPGACVEIWGADSDGTVSRARGSRHAGSDTRAGVGRSFATDDGQYQFWTRDPGAEAGQAPFFTALVFARGLPDKLHTRIYLPENVALLAADPLLASLDEVGRRSLIARRTPDGNLVHDIRLHGENATAYAGV